VAFRDFDKAIQKLDLWAVGTGDKDEQASDWTKRFDA